MNVEEIKQSMKTVLEENEQEYEDVGIDAIFDIWNTNKNKVRKILSKHPNWNEEAQAIVGDISFPARVNFDEVRYYISEIFDRITRTQLDTEFLKMVYNQISLTVNRDHMSRLERMAASHSASWIMDIAHDGMKFTKLLHAFFEHENYRSRLGKSQTVAPDGTAREQYNFDIYEAKLFDALSTKEKKFKVYLSIHPADYLNMSHGTGWKSCHRIKDGSYAGGTISYLLDDCSTICSVVAGDRRELWQQEKVNRVVVMVNKSNLLISRLYPNYSDSSIRKIIADWIKSAMSEINGGTGYTLTACGDLREYVNTTEGSLHYKDYAYDQYNAHLYRLDSYVRNTKFNIGHKPVCVSSGLEFSYADDSYKDNLHSHYFKCAICGSLHTGKGIYDRVEHKTYCSDCAYKCDTCGRIHLKSNSTAIEHIGCIYCPDCAAIKQAPCNSCGTVHWKDEMYSVDNQYYCSTDCLNTANISVCGACGKLSYIKNAVAVSFNGEEVGTVCRNCSTAVRGFISVHWINTTRRGK